MVSLGDERSQTIMVKNPFHLREEMWSIKKAFFVSAKSAKILEEVMITSASFFIVCGENPVQSTGVFKANNKGVGENQAWNEGWKDKGKSSDTLYL